MTNQIVSANRLPKGSLTDYLDGFFETLIGINFGDEDLITVIPETIRGQRGMKAGIDVMYAGMLGILGVGAYITYCFSKAGN